MLLQYDVQSVYLYTVFVYYVIIGAVMKMNLKCNDRIGRYEDIHHGIFPIHLSGLYLERSLFIFYKKLRKKEMYLHKHITYICKHY